MPEATVHTIIPAMVTQCVARLPIAQPKRPAMMAPASGAIGTRRYSFCIVGIVVAGSSLEPVEIFHVYGVDVPEEHHQYREPDGGLRSRDGEDEEDEHLTGDVA